MTFREPLFKRQSILLRWKDLKEFFLCLSNGIIGIKLYNGFKIYPTVYDEWNGDNIQLGEPVISICGWQFCWTGTKENLIKAVK